MIPHCPDHEDIALSCRILEELRDDVREFSKMQQTILEKLAILDTRVARMETIPQEVTSIQEWKNRMIGAIGVLFIIITIYGVKIFV